MFKNWSYNPTRKSYIGVEDIADHLPAGLYALTTAMYGEPMAHQHPLRKDSTLQFKHGPLPRVLAEVQRFWSSAEHYRQLGVSHKRGILLYGPPGCGKTGILSVLIEDTIAQGGLVFQVTGANADYLPNALPSLRQIEKDRPLLVVMEDLESILANSEEEILELLDGASNRVGDGIVFLATTNNLQSIPARIRCRPSRIDTLIEVGFPSLEQRYEYLKFLLGKDDPKTEELAKDWSQQCGGFSLALLKELVVSIRIYGKTVPEAVALLKELSEESEEENEE